MLHCVQVIEVVIDERPLRVDDKHPLSLETQSC